MNTSAVDKIVQTVLYEGYMLYPYRRSSLKNQHRWNFGIVYPAGMQPDSMTTECLVEGADGAAVHVEVRFLQVYEKDSWQEVVERSVTLDSDGLRSFEFDGVEGLVHVSRDILQAGLAKIRTEIRNRTKRDAARDSLLQSFVSTHTILRVNDAEFVSLLDPPEAFRQAVASCRNIGAWPVLVGKDGARDCMLSSPIILYDYPRVADESPGDAYDSTEIDEILMLRILTLSDAEKDEMRQSGERERRLLDRAESLTPEQMMKLHGAIRSPRSGLSPGDRVRLRPKPGGDIFDVVLRNRIAIVESVEQDFENRTHVAVVIEDDPGRDLGLMRQPGHRFFFSADELERIA